MCLGNLPLYVVTSVLKKILEVKNANFYLLCVVPSTLKEVHIGRCLWEINFIRGKVNRHTCLYYPAISKQQNIFLMFEVSCKKLRFERLCVDSPDKASSKFGITYSLEEGGGKCSM